MNIARLVEAEWQPLVVWECELRDMVAVEKKVQGFLGPAGRVEHRC
jgi:G:T-mismatch repair DNA endonuclease (very short patch repair protein)